MFTLVITDTDGDEWSREFETRFAAVEYLHRFARRLNLVVVVKAVTTSKGTAYIVRYREQRVSEDK